MSNATNWKTQTALVIEGGYGSGFWKWNLYIDLAMLKDGKGEDAITVSQDHDTVGSSWNIHHGIAVEYNLPDGVKVSEVEALIEDIIDRADELTAGFTTEWNGSNHVAKWYNEDGEQVNVEYFEAETAAEKAYYFWNELETQIGDMDCLMHYDLADTENLPYVHEHLQGRDDYSEEGTEEELQDRIEALLYEVYDQDQQDEYIYSGFGSAAEKIAEHILDNRDEDEDSE